MLVFCSILHVLNQLKPDRSEDNSLLNPSDQCMFEIFSQQKQRVNSGMHIVTWPIAVGKHAELVNPLGIHQQEIIIL